MEPPEDNGENAVLSILNNLLGRNDDPLEHVIFAETRAEIEAQGGNITESSVLDCSKYFAEKYADMLNETMIRLYTDAFVAIDADFCRFRWLDYYVEVKGVAEDDFDLYYLGDGVFDWDEYNNRIIPDVVLTYKDWFIDEYADLNITSEEYDMFENGLNFDWTGFWESREPPEPTDVEDEGGDGIIDINDLPDPVDPINEDV